MNRFRIALLASCVAMPALAQEVPAIDNTQAMATATAQAQIDGARARAQAKVAADLRAQQDVTNQQQTQQTQTNGQGTVPRAMPPRLDPVAPDKPLPMKASANLSVARRWITKYQKATLDGDGVVHFVEGKGQIFVVTAVNHVTDIVLASGERVTDKPVFGDKDGWRALVTSSGVGRKAVTHILIKPSDAGYSSNLVIVTNLRSSSIELVSRRADYMPKVALDLPDDDEMGWNKYAAGGGQSPPSAITDPCDQVPTIAPDQFDISGDKNATWRPVQVYAVSTAVGMKTCVEFPSSIGSEDLPAILALANDGSWFSSPSKKIVNVRYVKRRYIADEMLSRFILVDGVGSDQRSITYTRKGN